MARVASLLLIAAGVIGVAMVLVPHTDRINTSAYAVLAACGISSGIGIWVFRTRIPPVAYHAVSGAGIVMVSLSIYYSGNDSGGAAENELLYLWPILFAGYFFGRRGMALQLGIVGLAYAGALIAIDAGDAGFARWVGAMGTLIAAAVFVRYLKERLDLDVSMHEATIESTADGILVVDDDGRWRSFNRNFLEMWGIPEEIVRSRDDDAAIEFVLEQLEDPPAFVAKIREVYDEPEAESYDELRFKDGRVFERYSRPQRVGGRSVGRVWSFRDVTEQKHAGERLQHLADHDPLTDLFNRRRFGEELEREISRSERYRRQGALLLIDLDNLKEVNDTHGHHWGDEMLRSTARAFSSRLRSSDILARFGGDEFAVLLPEADALRARKLAEELLEMMRRRRIETDSGEIGITLSIGVVTLETLASGGPEPLVAADKALYRAKRQGRDRFVVYEGVGEASRPATDLP